MRYPAGTPVPPPPPHFIANLAAIVHVPHILYAIDVIMK